MNILNPPTPVLRSSGDIFLRGVIVHHDNQFIRSVSLDFIEGDQYGLGARKSPGIYCLSHIFLLQLYDSLSHGEADEQTYRESDNQGGNAVGSDARR